MGPADEPEVPDERMPEQQTRRTRVADLERQVRDLTTRVEILERFLAERFG